MRDRQSLAMVVWSNSWGKEAKKQIYKNSIGYNSYRPPSFQTEILLNLSKQFQLRKRYFSCFKDTEMSCSNSLTSEVTICRLPKSSSTQIPPLVGWGWHTLWQLQVDFHLTKTEKYITFIIKFKLLLYTKLEKRTKVIWIL